MIYADHNATSVLRPEAKAAMLEAMDIGANPSSVHSAGRKARRLLETARMQIGGAISASGKDIIFTSGGTEANRLALIGAARQIAAKEGKPPAIIYAGFEHAAVLENLPDTGASLFEVCVRSNGIVDLDHLAERVRHVSDEGFTPLVTLMLANNETGVIQPVSEAAALAREAKGYIHCDAVQALGKIPVNVALLGVDYLALSGHKCGGPAGVGALWLRPGAPLLPIHKGGGQERSLRSGTENLVGIVGFGAAAEKSVQDLDLYSRLSLIRDAMESDLKAAGAIVFGNEAGRLANTSCIALPGFKSETQVMSLDLAGIAISAGSACSSGKVKASGVLKAMGVSADIARCAVRISFGWDTADDDGAAIASAWKEAAARVVGQ